MFAKKVALLMLYSYSNLLKAWKKVVFVSKHFVVMII